MHKFTRVAVALMLTGIVSACAVGPDYQAPDNVSTIELTTSYQTADAVKSWWQAFEDETLSSLIELALTENRSLHEALANVRRAQAVFSESGAQRWPQGSVSAGYQAVENTSLLDADDGVQLRGFNTGLSLNWDADLAGKLVRAEQAALARAEQADLLWRDAQLQVISQVVNSYGQYRGAQIRLVCAQMNLAFLQQSRDVIQAQVDAGTATTFELAQIDTQIHRVETDIPSMRIAQATAKRTLAALVARQADELELGGAASLPTLRSPLPVAQGENYLQYRPDVASAERALAASVADIGVATASLYPSLSVSGFLGFLSSPGLALNSASQSWSIAPTLQWSGLNWSAVKAQVRASNAEADAQLARFEQSVIEAVNDMDLSLQSYQFSREQLASAKQQFKASQQSASIARIRYEEGSLEFLQLLDTERELIASRDQLAQIEQTHFLRLVEVYRSFSGALQWQQPG